ncbi:MAG: Chaperone protein DnaK [Syntrophorhabdus sp. PtaU1.Bin153]|nr:MAG: Chaperone protein DnaK [Syntrophorhabdus sp. PtaU1.Bin153]
MSEDSLDLFAGNTGSLKAATKSFRVLGIDLGTTNSSVSEIVWWPEEQQRLTSAQCNPLEIEQPTDVGIFVSPLVPSAVAILPDGEAWVGEGAKRLRAGQQTAGLVFEKTLFFDTKNEMGLKKTYFRAQERFNAPWKIAGRILSFLSGKGMEMGGPEVRSTVVTVPASFQLNQRRDTVMAAKMAGIDLKEYDLLDEPIAALIDYLMTRPPENLFDAGVVSNMLVFDFGGGTCDVSVVQTEVDRYDKQVKASILSVSRYHRLGGGDIDAAIVHEHLMPALLAENNVSQGELTWSQKKRVLEPQMLTTAESLKIALCREIDVLQKHGRYDTADKTQIIARQPGLRCMVGNRGLVLSRPQLNADELEKTLQPFLDTELLFATETEYRLTQSVFAPIEDGISRSGIKKDEINFVLLVGGSTLIPAVRDAISRYFPATSVGFYEDYLDVQLAVSRGAAWHSLIKEVTGRPFIQPVVGDTIALLTGEGTPYTIIPSGTPIPYPADGSYARLTNLAVPGTLTRKIKMEIAVLSSGQLLFSETWHVKGMVNAGDPVTMEYRIDGNSYFECRAFLESDPGEVFQRSVENPLTNTVSPNKIRLQIEEAEEEFRQRGGFSAEDCDAIVQVARWYRDLKQLERSQEYLKTALRLNNRPDADILNLMGINYGELGNFGDQEKMYKEADKYSSGSWGGAMFNLSLSYTRQKRYEEALGAIEQALSKERDSSPYLTQKSLCLKALGKGGNGMKILEHARQTYAPPDILDDWELGWFETCCRHVDDKDMLERISIEKRKRKQAGTARVSSDGERPIMTGGLRKA